MLITHHSYPLHATARRAQSGVVLLVALIMLVAMTLAGLALVRSVDTATIIAGNLSFQQAATQSGDIGVEDAIAKVDGFINLNTTSLETNVVGREYYAADGLSAASGRNANETWDAYWTRKWAARPAVALAKNTVTGNTISYVIDRLCFAQGTPTSLVIVPPSTVAVVNCPPSPVVTTTTGTTTGNDEEGGTPQIDPGTSVAVSQVYYRITARIQGPRNTLSYVQAIIAK